MAERTFVYQSIVGQIETMIRDGVLRAGERAPSLRGLSTQLGVSITSVMKAYTVLEGRGFLEASPQSGFYVKPPRLGSAQLLETTRPEPERISVEKGRLIVSFLESINDPENLLFGCASPDPNLLPVGDLGKIMSSLGREHRNTMFEYELPPGNKSLRRQIGRLSLSWGCSLAPKDMVVTSGALDALNLCLRAVARPGDVIALESPTYFGILQAIENLNLKAIEIPTHPQKGVDLDVLEDHLAKKMIKACLFMPNFNNPMGSLMPDGNKARLAAMLNQYQTPLIEDDIYGDIYFGETRPKPVKAFDQHGWVILCSSFSKTLGPGLRVGFAISERYCELIKHQQFMTTLAAPSPSQECVARFLASGRYDRHLRKFRRIIETEVSHYQQKIIDQFPSGTRVARPQGGFVLWVRLPEGITGESLFTKAQAHHLSFAPGSLFTARQDFKNYIRLNCAHPPSPRVDLGLETLGRLAREIQESGS